MKSQPSTCGLFILFIILLVSLTTGELELYQDVESEPLTDESFKTLKRILKFGNHQHGIHQTRAISNTYSHDYDEYLPNYTPKKQKTVVEMLFESPRFLEMLQKNKLRNINYQQRPDYDILNNYPRSIVERERSYVNLESPSKFYEYPNVNIPYPESNVNEKMYFSHIPARMTHLNWNNFEDNLADASSARVKDEMIESHISKSKNIMKINPMLNLSQKSNEPEFSYQFEEPSINAYDTFGIKPNDPRYYEDDSILSNRNVKQMISNNKNSHTTEVENEKKIIDEDNTKIISHLDSADSMNNKFSHFRSMMPEPQRRTDQEAVVTSSAIYKVNNDVYFIAIVAGCSAAAMFALVLISLTWCRLQRGAKAAADIDYPAYGVTGPNKDISPSGDQRLAHSAQMYHFQHQKQQIIAMEKTTAAREPGSVSEAESDEENEEGDYTVYECPGLAPAGEMEVKNPLFHDDPTPTTPSQNHKETDHSKQ